MLVLGEFAPPKPFLPAKFMFLKVTHVIVLAYMLFKKSYIVYACTYIYITKETFMRNFTSVNFIVFSLFQVYNQYLITIYNML